jgi:hypothetical protein
MGDKGGKKDIVKRTRVFIFIVLLLLIEACSLSKLAWNHAEWLAMYELNHYFDLSREEENLWRPRVASLIPRLQKQAGPELVVFLQRIRGTVQNGLTEENVASLFREWDEFRVRHFCPITGDVAEFLVSLDKDNVAYFRKRLSESQKHLTESLSLSDEDYKINRISHARQQVERYYGRITATQATMVGTLLGLSRQSQRDHMEQEQDTQKNLLTIFEHTDSSEKIRVLLDQWIRDPSMMQTTENLRTLYKAERNASIRNIAAIDRIMTQEQRKYLIGKIDEWTQDLQESLANAKR